MTNNTNNSQTAVSERYATLVANFHHFTDDMIVWAIRETSTKLDLEQLVTERGGTHFTRTLLTNAANQQGAPREAMITCAAATRTKVVALMFEHFGTGPYLRDRRNAYYREINELRFNRATYETRQTAATTVGPATIGRILADSAPFVSGCVERALEENNEDRANSLIIVAAEGIREYRGGSYHFTKNIPFYVEAADPEIVKTALQSRRSAQTVLLEYAQEFDTPGMEGQADALYALGVIPAALIRDVVPGHMTIPKVIGRQVDHRVLEGAHS